MALAMLALALCSAMPAAKADATLDRIRERGKITIGVIVNGNSAFGSIDPGTGKPVGFNPELARKIASELSVQAELVPVLPTNRVQFLQQGKVDLLVASMLLTPERTTLLDHVPTPYYRNGGTAIFLKSSGIRRWEDLRGKSVCLSQGSSYAKPLAATYGAELKGFKGMAESLLALRGGASCVAAVHESLTLNQLVARDPQWRDYAVLPEEVDPAPQVAWVRKGEKDTVSAVDRVLQRLHGSGWLIGLEARLDLVPRSPLLVQLQQQYGGKP
ncbi:High affinity periplasmic solute-binding protein high affinity transport system (plasmid) [Cupriavidus taiwanensis]|uniref:High affinity periplasmic solute-binding protein high affinity transport system n=2 Tax=Cupriavidus taiwanensis TaxID=164546 RepID=A0A375I6R7_9BURK|nr:High affinity periplasmic solute-binding protein high affinity transport system [Cupriavidus taiwanensis]SPK77121.1 High affinity periplasmic solute-binding protein high affinity transport system [Cupriavidus taiwanensis]